MPPGGVWRENEGVVIRFPRGIGSAGVLGVLPGVRRGKPEKRAERVFWLCGWRRMAANPQKPARERALALASAAYLPPGL